MMKEHDTNDPYAGNILTYSLGPILTRDAILKAMSKFPKVPKNLHDIPKHIRMHHLLEIRDLHIASEAGADLFTTLDVMIRQGYRYRDPNNPATWRNIGGDKNAYVTPKSPAMAAVAVGISGSGKTETTYRALSIFPAQISVHETFPNSVSGLNQVNWLSTDVASTGKSSDLAENLMREWDRITGGNRFDDTINRPRRDGMQMLNEWRQVASAHFLGLLHLDEVQNFFRIPTIERRRKNKKADIDTELSIVEDALLRWILSLTNIWQIPLLLTGTPDGIGALTKRFSTSQRIVTCGYHRISHFDSADDVIFQDIFLRTLFKYQYVGKKLQLNSSIANLIFELTGGVQRIIIALWISAHRVAYQRNDDELRVEDFVIAANKYLGILRPAIDALLSKDPNQYDHFEDLMKRDDGFWTTFWNPNI